MEYKHLDLKTGNSELSKVVRNIPLWHIMCVICIEYKLIFIKMVFQLIRVYAYGDIASIKAYYIKTVRVVLVLFFLFLFFFILFLL